MASINFEANNNSIEGKSHVILRTNPLLSSNVKLVVDSNDQIYLDSISANRTLSEKRYKKFSLDASGHYAYDVASYFANTPFDTVYEPLRIDSDLSVYREYRRQYEEQYQYGARLNGAKDFDENIRFMAPLWIDEKLPEYFVIYRIEEPVSEVALTDDLYGINDRIMKMLSNATIVKTFDLRKGSKIGNYLDTFTNDPKRPKAPLTISFEKDEKSTWNGIDLRKGGFTSKGEYIYKDFVLEDRVEILNNEFITNGFKRNQMISANLINMEFLFEDFDNAYDVNRYIGIYVNAHEEGEFKHVKYAKDILQIEENTVTTNFDLSNTGLTAVDMLPDTELRDPILQFVKSGDSFGHIKNVYQGVSDPLKLNVKAFDIDDSQFVRKQDTLTITNFLEDVKDFIEIEITENPSTGDQWIIGATTEVLQVLAPFSEYVIVADSNLTEGTFDAHKFSTKGTLREIARAMRGAILNIKDLHLDVQLIGTKLLITNYKTGNRTYNMFFGAYKTNVSTFNVIGLNDDTVQKLRLDNFIYTRYNVYAGLGGSYKGKGLLVTESESGDINENTYIKIGKKYIKVVEILEDPVNRGYYRVCLSQDFDKLKIRDINLPLYIENTIKFGKFEAFDFYDFDFNFYSEVNSKLGELNYEINYDIDGVVDTYDPNTGDYTGQLETITGDYARLQGAKNAVTQNSSGVTYVSTEYDRLQENYNTELALTSRVIPTINKWKYYEGTTARELPYMLTMSEAFGKTNFSPDIEVNGRSISDLTHEWYYLYKHPNYDGVTSNDDVAQMVRTLSSYIQPENGINLEASHLTDVTNNYFDRLFVYEGYDVLGSGFAPAGPSKKYVRLANGSSQAPAEALFRGLKVKLYNRKEFNETNPRNLLTSSQFNDYKFTAVLNYNNDPNGQNNVEIKAIQNKKFKFVCLYIEINSTDDSIETINRELLYRLRDVFDNGQLGNTVINGYIDFSIQQDVDGKYADGLGVNSELARDIQIDTKGNYKNLYFQYGGKTFELPVISVPSNNAIRVKCDNYKIYDTLGTTQLNLTGLTSSDWANIVFTYEDGGANLAKSMFSYVSAKNLADTLNNNDTERIEYLTVEEDGTINSNRFIINIEDGNKVVKRSRLVPTADPNKPQSYKVSSGKVGSIVVERTDVYDATLIRMAGHYTPHTRPVVTFTDLYQYYKTTQIEDLAPLTLEEQREKVLYNTYNRMGIAFSSYVNRGQYKFGLIEDMFYHKVNPEKADGILKLSSSTGSQPKYPLIDEVAIDKRDVNVFRSSWEDEFYVKNGTKKNNKNVYGTLSTYEESAFLASTLNLPKTQYEITNYSVISIVNSLSDLKAINSSKNYLGDIVQFEDLDRIYLDVYVNNLLVDLLEVDNAGHAIERYVIASESYGDKSTVKDDIRKYIEVNLLKLMNIEDIQLYVKDDNSISSSEVVSAENLNEILDSGYKLSNDFRIEYDTTNALKLRVIYNKRVGFNHKLYMYIKIRS